MDLFSAQHLIRMRWESLNVDERQQMVSMAVNLLQESAKPNEPWVLKSQVSALMAEVGYFVKHLFFITFFATPLILNEF